MQKIKVRKDVAEQITSKLKTPENSIKTAKNDVFNTDFAENLQNQDEISEEKQVTSKLQANKNIFVRGDFDEYKISDEELKRHEIDSEGIEKGIRTIYVPPTINRKGYQYNKMFPDNKKDNSYQKKETYETDEERLKRYIWENGKRLTDKRFLDLSKNEIKKLINQLRSCHYYDNEGIHVAYGRTDNLKTSTNTKELKGAKVLRDLGIEVFLLPDMFAYGKNGSEKKTFGDAIALHKNHIMDFKQVDGENAGSNYSKAMKQGHDCLLYITNPYMSLEKVKEQIQTVYEKKYISKKRFRMNSDVIVYFEDNNKTYLLKYGKNGKLLKEKDLSVYKASLTKATNYNTLSLNNVVRINNIIPQQNNLSSKNVTKSLTYSGHKLQGRTRLYGMDISIENKKGSYRSGVDKDGHKWRTYMNYDYGYIRGTVGTDKDHLDCYVGPDKEAQKVYIVHQNDPITHKYDEDKCMLCFSSADAAKKAYMKQYDRPGFYGSMTTMTIDEFKSFIFSHKGKMVHKSFDIQITDITENNKQQKLEQFSKALNAIADNRQFVIKHIPADNSTRYENLTVRLMDFDRSKIEKAVHKVALSLDADVLASSKGESFVYESQKEITEQFYKKVTDSARAVYNFVISYFDLPDIRIISKAGELKHKGKIIYNPETGKPIQESEWKKFVVELEKFLNRNYTGIGQKIVLSSESLGIILDRLSKTNSLEAIRKMPLSTLKAKRYDVDWISESIKNMKDQFGEVISRERQARIQIAMDSAAQRVTRVKDDMKNNIQQIIIDGIRDKQSKSVVAQNLFDKCASLNRDMQRIADSEVQMAANSAYCKEEVYNSKPNEKVYFKRFEMMDDNTCKQCKKLNGTIVLWSEVPLPDEHIRDPYAKYAIWDGKNEGSCPVGIVHPYCRGSWIRYYPDLD